MINRERHYQFVLKIGYVFINSSYEHLLRNEKNNKCIMFLGVDYGQAVLTTYEIVRICISPSYPNGSFRFNH